MKKNLYCYHKMMVARLNQPNVSRLLPGKPTVSSAMLAVVALCCYAAAASAFQMGTAKKTTDINYLKDLECHSLHASEKDKKRGDGIKSDVQVRLKQWQIVRSIMLSHDIKRIAPLLSDRKGITCVSWWRGLKRIETNTYHYSKADFIRSIEKGRFDDNAGTFTGEPNRVYAWLWAFLKERHPESNRGGQVWQLKPSRSRDEKPLAEVTFICEDGRLKISVISAHVSGD